MEEISRARKVEEIHAARLGRLLDEPGIDEPQVVVRVRHIDLGLVNHRQTTLCVRVLKRIYEGYE